MAPEVISGLYNIQADLWSIGVLLYTLVSGYLPFQGENSTKVFQKIKKGDYHFRHKEFEDVSDECKNLIRQLLEIDPSKRLTGSQALLHPWFERFEEEQVSSDLLEYNWNVIERLRKFRGVSHLKKALLNQLVKMADDKDIHELRVSFQSMDKDGTGFISVAELTEAVHTAKVQISDQEISELIKDIDYVGNGKINYSEFLSASIYVPSFVDDSKLKVIFNLLDTSQTGFIT